MRLKPRTHTGGGVEDGSWNAKRANCLQISTERGKREFFLCDNSDEHKQWFDAVYYATTVSKLAEYCSPLSGGWLHFYEVGAPSFHTPFARQTIPCMA